MVRPQTAKKVRTLLLILTLTQSPRDVQWPSHIREDVHALSAVNTLVGLSIETCQLKMEASVKQGLCFKHMSGLF